VRTSPIAALGIAAMAVQNPAHLAAQGHTVLAVDADINQDLAATLGEPADEAARHPTLGGQLEEIKEYLRGSNPRITT
jgi:CO dehydrogenase maturation factor